MSYEVGQRIRVPLTVSDVNGVATDATVTVSVQHESGTLIVPSVVDDAGTGVYHFDVVPTAAGLWQWTATATGAVETVSRGQFYVRTGALGIISLREAKEHLNKRTDDTTDDAELLDWIDAITIALEKIVGPVVAKSYTEYHSGPGYQIILRNRPVIAVTQVVETWGAGDVRTLASEVNGGPYGDNDYVFDVGTSTITRRSAGWVSLFPYGTNNIRVTYTAGRNPIPANLRQAAKELLTHHWRASQLASGTTRPRTDIPADTASMGIAIPNRVNLLIGSKRAPRLGG